MSLVTIWFALVVLCWVMFFLLEGFDFGVGLLAPLLGRSDRERSAVLATIGPVWDGNEVWLIAAIGVTFAAFPAWYAALLAGLYLPMVAVLLLLAGRGVALEFRGKRDDAGWRRRCDLALAACSGLVALLWGVVLSAFTRGLSLNAGGNVVARSGAWNGLGRTIDAVLTPAGLTGGVLTLAAVLLLGATFLGLRTTGPVRARARRLAIGLAAVGLPAGLVTALVTGLLHHGPAVLIALAAAALLTLVGLAAWGRREAIAFALTGLTTAAAVVTVFTHQLTAGHHVVLASTLNSAWSLTMSGAAADPSALRLISTVGVVVLPGVLVYQAYSYWVFRHRISSGRTA